jgi:hypothetical protein
VIHSLRSIGVVCALATCSGGHATGCNALVNAGPDVPETQVATDPPGAGGGTILLGHFYLTGWQTYTGVGGASGPTGNTRRQLRYFSDATHYDLVTADNGGVETTESRTYTTVGTTLNSNQTCPTVDFFANDYSVLNLGVTLVLFSAPSTFSFTRDEIFADGFGP